jgi:hypothetical protein
MASLIADMAALRIHFGKERPILTAEVKRSTNDPSLSYPAITASASSGGVDT